MASSSSLKMTEETFQYICTSCAEEDYIKEALKYCLECQQYCCKDCLTYHRLKDSLQGHTLLDYSSVKSQGQPMSLPAFPTLQCRQHNGKITNFFCKTHDAVFCYVCAAENHKICKDTISISDNIDQLYDKSCTSKATSDLGYILDRLNKGKSNTKALLKQLEDSKATAINNVRNFRIEMEKLLKKLEDASIKKIEDEYQKFESKLLEEKKKFGESIDEFKNIEQLFVRASGNIAQLFACTKIAEKKCSTVGDTEVMRERFDRAEVKFLPSEELKTNLARMKHLGDVPSILSKKYSMYKATKIGDMNVKLKEEEKAGSRCLLSGSCIVDDTVMFTDSQHKTLKRFDASTLSLIDYCKVPTGPQGVCRVGDKELAVACLRVVQFVSLRGKLSLSRSIRMQQRSHGIAFSYNILYITDMYKSLYMYDMSGNLLKTVTSDNCGQPVFALNHHIIFNANKSRLFVCDDYKGLVCFNAQCEYIETVRDSDFGFAADICLDGYDNVIVASRVKQTVVQCDKDGRKCGIIVNNTSERPICVCIHHGLKRMFVGLEVSDTVEVYNLTWKKD